MTDTLETGGPESISQPEAAENSTILQESSNPQLVDQVFSLFKGYLSSQLEEKSKQLERKSKIDKELKFKGNRKQFELNFQLNHI